MAADGHRGAPVTAALLSLTGAVVVALVALWIRPVFAAATYQYRGRTPHTTELPFFVPTEADRMEVGFTVTLGSIRFGTYRVKPDDCIEELRVNDLIVDDRAIFCDYGGGRSVDLSPYLRS